jgi:hypothetical protein
MKFFFDNNLSPNLVRGLKSFGEDVIHLTDIFPPDEPDSKWLKHIGENGLTLITRDEAIRWHPAEKEAFRVYQVGAFFLGGKKRSAWDIIQQVIRHWPRIKELANNSRRPYAYIIPPSGTKIRQIVI